MSACCFDCPIASSWNRNPIGASSLLMLVFDFPFKNATRMKIRIFSKTLTVLLLFVAQTGLAADDEARLAELNAYWAEVSRSVREGDFEGYRATCHEEGVLVSGSSQTCHPFSKALARWKPGFMDTRAARMKASVEFRFSQRYGDETTAHETGIFLYSTTDAEGKSTQEYVNFEALLVKKGGWKIMMEYQKSKATREEWDALK